MQDLIANLLGALAGWVLAHLIMRDGADRTSDAES
jgi:glycopeptide antibiotics resistance protein